MRKSRLTPKEEEELAREIEQERKRRAFYKNYNPYQYEAPSASDPNPIPDYSKLRAGTTGAGEATNENIMVKMFERILAGPPPSIRIIARFGQSNYDITITKPEELEAVQAIVNKFINAFQPTSNNF